MLEVRNLCKTYRSKDGVSVEATKDISLRFPERGMVFLLGRSGSGKSTLLHLLGGLDRYDSGEILINGTSTKEFSNSMMDSYRNTYVGFVFQDYNILPEFNVGANIALALELQGIRATNDRINEILAEVDLSEYAKRKPNELSGGQLQRVAIARALIKDPDIILADEPTGALDSATGRQVFETLKKLSKRKLVIIVSHDRDYSEQYADRIIELADGRVISDVELASLEDLEEDPTERIEFRPEDGIRADKDGLTVANRYELTEEDRRKINRFLELQKDNNVLLLEGTRLLPKEDRFRDTDEAAITPEKTEFTPVKSKLPWKRSFGIGLNSLKHKKVTLFFTVVLSVVAFVLFGMADVFYSFDKITCMTDTVWESKVSYLKINKSFDFYGSYNYSFEEYPDDTFTDEEIRKLEEITGQTIIPAANKWTRLMFIDSSDTSRAYDYRTDFQAAVYPDRVWGVVEIDQARLEGLGITIEEGRLPEPGTDEVCISSLAADAILLYGNTKQYSGKQHKDLIGTKLYSTMGPDGQAPVICGILDIPVDIERYRKLIPDSWDSLSDAERLVKQIYLMICHQECSEGLPSYVFCAPGCSSRIGTNRYGAFEPDSKYCRVEGEEYEYYEYVEGITDISGLIPERIVWIPGHTGELKENEAVVSLNTLLYAFYTDIKTDSVDPYDMPVKEIAERLAEILPEHREVKFRIGQDASYDIVGIFVPEQSSGEDLFYREGMQFAALTDSEADSYRKELEKTCRTLYCHMPDSKREIRALIEYGESDMKKGMTLEVNQESTYIISTVDEASTYLSPYLRWIGIVFAVFSAVLFAVFIANSVIHKKQEIGVLRAVGARSLDVYRIFLCETGVIAVFNWLVSSGIVYLITSALNKSFQGDYLPDLMLLHFSVRQVLLLFLISIGIALIATFLPIWGIARRKPIDVIRDR